MEPFPILQSILQIIAFSRMFQTTTEEACSVLSSSSDFEIQASVSWIPPLYLIFLLLLENPNFVV
ncbi:hypothetical protein Hanom_Chr11g01008931 [Helianthus anomalus]